MNAPVATDSRAEFPATDAPTVINPHTYPTSAPADLTVVAGKVSPTAVGVTMAGVNASSTSVAKGITQEVEAKGPADAKVHSKTIAMGVKASPTAVVNASSRANASGMTASNASRANPTNDYLSPTVANENQALTGNSAPTIDSTISHHDAPAVAKAGLARATATATASTTVVTPASTTANASDGASPTLGAKATAASNSLATASAAAVEAPVTAKPPFNASSTAGVTASFAVVVMTGVSKNVRQPTSPLRMCLKVAFLLI